MRVREEDIKRIAEETGVDERKVKEILSYYFDVGGD